jgi:hypothetical protein
MEQGHFLEFARRMLVASHPDDEAEGGDERHMPELDKNFWGVDAAAVPEAQQRRGREPAATAEDPLEPAPKKPKKVWTNEEEDIFTEALQRHQREGGRLWDMLSAALPNVTHTQLKSHHQHRQKHSQKHGSEQHDPVKENKKSRRKK